MTEWPKPAKTTAFFPVNVHLHFPQPTREMWIEAVGQGFPIVMRNRRIQMMFKMIEVVEGDQLHQRSAKKPRAHQTCFFLRVVGNVNGHKRKRPASRDHQCDIDEWRGASSEPKRARPPLRPRYRLLPPTEPAGAWDTFSTPIATGGTAWRARFRWPATVNRGQPILQGRRSIADGDDDEGARGGRLCRCAETKARSD